MALARSLIVDQLVTSVYHCVSRCVRRQFLLSDAVRTAWLIQRLEFLASLFAIDILEFAILANHIHLLLRIRPEVAWCWTAEEVAERWLALRAAGPFARAGEPSARPSKEDIAELAADEALVDELRRRLADLGWFHKELKEPCARLWNEEDDVTGHFWEGRYSSKVALDDVALTAQAFYVMLNAVRAGAESGVGRSGTTSIGLRMKRIVREIRAGLHGDAVEAYERRVVNGSWQPAMPCDPGSVEYLSDEEYSARVARGRGKAEVRNAAMREAETIGRLAVDAKVEELASMMACGGDGDEVRIAQEPGGSRSAVAPRGSLARIPRHRLRPRQSSRIPADAAANDRTFSVPLENPFRAERMQEGSTAVLPGMTLGPLVALLDADGRQVHPGKRGRILPGERSALGRFRAMALGGEIEEPAIAMATGSESAVEVEGAVPTAAPSDALAALGEKLRATVAGAIRTIEGHRRALAKLVGTDPEAAEGVRRVRWFGSASGDEERVGAEASRRGRSRAVVERPVSPVSPVSRVPRSS